MRLLALRSVPTNPADTAEIHMTPAVSETGTFLTLDALSDIMNSPRVSRRPNERRGLKFFAAASITLGSILLLAALVANSSIGQIASLVASLVS